MNKKYLLYVIVPIATLAIYGGTVLADTKTDQINPMTNLVNAIAQKFNLNTNDVQAVFDEQHTQMRTQRQEEMSQNFTDRLAKAVTDGKLTQAQSDLIIAKKAELQAQTIDLKDKTKEEVQTIMKTNMDSLKQWASDNNIPINYIQLGFGGHGKGDMMGRGGFMMGEKPAN